MKLNFNLNDIGTVEFGLGIDAGPKEIFCAVPVDGDVQDALIEMVTETWRSMHGLDREPSVYEPSEKHAAHEYLYIPLSDPSTARLRQLHEAENISLNSGAFRDPARFFAYFARFTDSRGRRLTALRRASQFKGIVKSRLVTFGSDALRLVREQIFRLDTDFDLLMDSSNIHILRPSGFEFAGKLQEEILSAVPGNLKRVAKDIPFVEFKNIAEYASRHPRAARYIASICSQKETQSIDPRALRSHCRATGVEVSVKGKRILVPDDQILPFLEVLDRRRYEITLVRDAPEQFVAASRRKIAKTVAGRVVRNRVVARAR